MRNTKFAKCLRDRYKVIHFIEKEKVHIPHTDHGRKTCSRSKLKPRHQELDGLLNQTESKEENYREPQWTSVKPVVG